MVSFCVRFLGLFLKRVLGRRVTGAHVPVNFENIDKWPMELNCPSGGYINDLECVGNIKLHKHQVFSKDNTISFNIRKSLDESVFDVGILNEMPSISELTTYGQLLTHFIDNSRVPNQWRAAGMHFAGFSLSHGQYILPSWTWTNGIVVQHYAESGQIDTAVTLADKLLNLQLACGGWVVRYDCKDLQLGVSSIVAPNDSAHCSDHGLLTAYELTGEPRFLEGAEKCAIWIMEEGNDDGLIRHGYNPMANEWDTKVNIVDIGFSASLFCTLYRLTGKQEYLDFAGKFLRRYIEVFYRGSGKFSSTVRGLEPYGKGIFARGTAWALEGLIPYYELTQDGTIGDVVDETVVFLLKNQHRNGGWLFNLRRGPVGLFSGYDNKGIPVIAASLARWKQSRPGMGASIDKSVQRAITWCLGHMRRSGLGVGGIYASNFEGAIIHSPNTEVALVYANCYLLALMRQYDLKSDLSKRLSK